ncbi:hypothetical protein [Nocardioides sp. WS12]|uniref:hypothetical protein n=1 Tax=Nocardioides sp. WS12 TaxID=2486272 RepID=UPI0015F7B2C4|nr:hypothetical protein [Nocardioides sp. WS12]
MPPHRPAAGGGGAARGLATVAFVLSLGGALEAAWILLLGFTAASQCSAANEVDPAAYLVPAVVLLAMPVVTALLRWPWRQPPLAAVIIALVVVCGLDFLGAGWSFVAIFFTDGC